MITLALSIKSLHGIGRRKLNKSRNKNINKEEREYENTKKELNNLLSLDVINNITAIFNTYSKIFNIRLDETNKNDLIDNIKFINYFNRNKNRKKKDDTVLGLTSVSYLSIDKYIEIFSNKKLFSKEEDKMSSYKSQNKSLKNEGDETRDNTNIFLERNIKAFEIIYDKTIDHSDYFIPSNQHCGNCWAHSTINYLKGYCKLLKDKLSDQENELCQNISVKELTLCGSDDGGCDGGKLGLGLEYLFKTGLIEEEKDKQNDIGIQQIDIQEYKSNKNNCGSNNHLKLVMKADYICECLYHSAIVHDGPDFKIHNSDCKKIFLNNKIEPPYLVGIKLKNKNDIRKFQHLKGEGIFKETFLYNNENESIEFNHAMVVTGYIVNNNNSKDHHFVVLNSHGEQWGNKGFMKYKRSIYNKFNDGFTLDYSLLMYLKFEEYKNLHNTNNIKLKVENEKEEVGIFDPKYNQFTIPKLNKKELLANNPSSNFLNLLKSPKHLTEQK